MESRHFTAPSRAPPLPPTGMRHHGTNASAHVLGQIGGIVEAALQDTRTHIALPRAEAGDHQTVFRLQKYLLSIKSILEVSHPAATPASRSTKLGAVQSNSQNSPMDPAAKVDARWDSFGEDSSRLKEELHKTMERLTQLKQDMLPPQTASQNGNAIESIKAQRSSNPAGPTVPLSSSRHSTADFIDTGESRLSQMSSIEEKLMGMDEKKTSGTRNARAFEESRQKPMLVPAEKLDPETMNKWQEIFRHRTRPQHPDSNKISQLPPMERVELESPGTLDLLWMCFNASRSQAFGDGAMSVFTDYLLIFMAPAAVIDVKDQHKDRVRTLCGPRLPTVFAVPTDSRQKNTQKQQPQQQQQHQHQHQQQQPRQQPRQQHNNRQYMHRPDGSYYSVMRTSGTSGGGGDSRLTKQPSQVSSASKYAGYTTASSQSTRYSTNAHAMSPYEGPHSQMSMPRNQSPYSNNAGRIMMSPAGSSAMRSPASNQVSHSNASYRDSYGYHQPRASQSNLSRSSTSGTNARAPSPNLWAQTPYGHVSPHSAGMHRW